MKVALLFPGYGSQFVGMGKELYDEYRIVQEYFEEASNCLDINFVKLCFASSDAEISKMSNAYTSLFLIESALAALLKEQGVQADCFVGYNNGEAAALCASGCFNFPDGLYLLSKFCSLYQDAVTAGDFDALHVQGVTSEVLERLCSEASSESANEEVCIALYNDDQDHIVTGNSRAISAVRDLVLNNVGTKVNYSGIEVGMHSAVIKQVTDQFKLYLEKVDFKDITIPFISSVDGSAITLGQDLKDYFIRSFNSPLFFTHIIDYLRNYDYIIVVGPGEQLVRMLNKKYSEKKVLSVLKGIDIELVKTVIT